MIEPRCAICSFTSRKLLAQCQCCHEYFCNYGDSATLSHILQHIVKTQHLKFSFPGLGQLQCSVCGRYNICAMYYDIAGLLYCKDHRTDDSAYIIHNNRVNFILPAPTPELIQQVNDMDSLATLESKNYAQAQITLAETKLLATDVGFEQKLQVLNSNLFRIPVRFPQSGLKVRSVRGQLFIAQKYAEQIEDGTVIASVEGYTSNNSKINKQLQYLQTKQFTYEDFMARALKAEFLMRRSYIEETKEPIATNLLRFRTQDNIHYQVFFPWGRYRRLCNQLVRPGDELCIDVITQQSTIPVFGSVVRCDEHILLRLDKYPPAQCILVKMHDINEIIFESVPDAGGDLFSSYHANYSVFHAGDGVSYLLKFSMKDSQMSSILRCVYEVSRNKCNYASFEILKGNFEGEVQEALSEASTELCTPQRASDIITETCTQLRESIAAGSELYEPNQNQVQAIRRSLTSCISLVQGCPGGGKTYTSALILKCLLRFYGDGQILCCAGSNIAADNLAFYALRLGIRATRVYARSKEDYEMQGTPYEVRACALHMIISRKVHAGAYVASGVLNYNTNDTLRQYIIANIPFKDSTVDPASLASYENLEKIEIAEAEVVISTCANSVYERVNSREYAAVLIDETSQIIEPDTILPIVCAPKHFILVGDQNYLGPTLANTQAANAGLGRSLYYRLLCLGIQPVRLHQYYRMHPGLLEFPNESFYQGKIQSGISCYNRMLKVRNPAQNCFAHLFQPNFPSFFWHINYQERQDQVSKSYYNEKEADIVISLVKRLRLEYGLREQQIGVITPYSAYQLFILYYLTATPDVEVNSVDGFYGREKDVVIFSCVRSNDDNQLGFLHEKRRVNVAMTRAKYVFIIVGNAYHLLKDKCVWSDVVQFYQQKNAIFSGEDVRSLKPYTVQTGKPDGKQESAQD